MAVIHMPSWLIVLLIAGVLAVLVLIIITVPIPPDK